MPESVNDPADCIVAVIIANWNRRDLLRACLASLEGQTLNGFQVILVDNGSTDGSAEMAEAEFGASKRFRLRVIRNRENRGFCAANNQGIQSSNSEYVALLNNDAEAEPGWLEALAGAFAHGEDVGMAASKILVWEDPSRIDKAGHLIYLDGQNRGRGSGELDQDQYKSLEETLWPDGCAAMYRRRMLKEIGGFDEDLFAYADDAELGLRARIAGWRCLYVAEAVVRHHRGATLGAFSSRRLELIERNRVLLAVKLFPWSLLWLNGIFYGARLAAGMWAAAANQGEMRHLPGWKGKLHAATALLKGDLAAVRLLPRFLSKRRKLEPIRRLSPSQLRKLLLQYRISLRELTRQSI